MPPLLEYIDSLLTGTGHDLDLRTFKLVDQLSGRMMGVRADITPQVARIDAHLLNRKGVTRLCYCGSVLHTRPAGPAATREPIQIGAEIYGEPGIAGRPRDPAPAVRGAGARRREGRAPGHRPRRRVPLDRAGGEGRTASARRSCSRRCRRRTFLRLRELDEEARCENARRAAAAARALWRRGSASTRAREDAAGDPGAEEGARRRCARWPRPAPVPASFDLAELRGYHYHSGVVFDAYCDGVSRRRWRAAGATTRSARRSAARGRRPDFRSICEALPA